MVNKDRIPNNPVGNSEESLKSIETGPETGPDPEIWEMTPEEYLSSLNGHEGERQIGADEPGFEFDDRIARERWLETVGEKIKENPNEVPENIRLKYDQLIEKQPRQLDASTSENPVPAVEKPEPPAKTNPSLEEELKDLKFQRALQEVVEKQITNERRLASALNTDAKTTRELFTRLENQGVISLYEKNKKPARQILWSRKRLREIIAQARGSRRTENSTLQEILGSKDLYIKCIARLLAESRKGKPFSQKGLIAKEFNLKRDEVDKLFDRLASDGLIEKQGHATALNPQAMADYLKTISENPPAPKEESETQSKEPENKATPPQSNPYNPEDPLSRWDAENPFSQQSTPAPDFEEVGIGETSSETPPPPLTAPEYSPAIETQTPPKNETPETSPAETLTTYTEKVYATANNLLIRKKEAEAMLAQLASSDPEIQKSLENLANFILEAPEKILAMKEFLIAAGDRFDKNEISHEEYLAEAEKILNQAHKEIDPILEKAEQDIKAIEDEIDSLPQSKETSAEAGIAAADLATEAEIEKSKNPADMRRWMGAVRKYWLRFALIALIGVSGETGFLVYQAHKKGGEETPADTKTPSLKKQDEFKIPPSTRGESSASAESSQASTQTETTATAEKAEPTEEEIRESLEDEVARRGEIISELKDSLAHARTKQSIGTENRGIDTAQTAFEKAREETEKNKAHSRVETTETTEKTGLTNQEIINSLEEENALLRKKLAESKVVATFKNKSRPEIENFTLNQILKKTGMNSDEYARLINETNPNREHWTVGGFIKTYGGINGLLAIGDIRTNTGIAMRRNNLAEGISEILKGMDQEKREQISKETLSEFFSKLNQ